MRPNKNVLASIFLTLIMLLSIGFAPVEWNEGSDEEFLDIEPTDEMDQTGARDVSGVQKLLVIGAKFSDMADTNFSLNQLKQYFEVDFADFYSNISYGDITIDADVYAWRDLPNPRSFYEDPSDKTVLIGTTVCQGVLTALESWASTNSVTIDFSSYTQLVCLVNGDSYRGWAYGPTFGTTFPLDLADGSKLKIPATVVSETGGLTAAGFWEVPPDPVEFWGRVAHEFGHLLGKRHVSSGYVNDYALMAGLYPGHMIAFKSNDADDCGTQLDWLPDANIVNATPGTIENIIIRPLELDIPGDTQAIRINVTDDDKVFYMVEVRKRINSDGYEDINGNDLMYDEGVVIYRVDRTKCNDAITIQDQASIDADSDGNDDGHEAWQVGDPAFTVIDGGIDISVEVVDTHLNGYVVKVSYKISGMTAADVSITPWNTEEGEYYTPDIWIDSQVNGWNWYANDGEPSDIPNNKSGDIPLVGHVNRLWFNVTNNGELAAMDVEVKAYWSTPPVAGMNTVNFDYIDNIIIDEIPPQSWLHTYIEWTPEVADLEADNVFDLHSCIKVNIVELGSGEATTGDNKAQENVHRFETTSSSPFHPVGMDFMVGNPYNYRTIVYAAVHGIPSGWNYQLAWDMEFVDPLSETPNSVTVTPPVFLSPYTDIGIPIDIQVVTWIENRDGEFGDIVVEHLGGNSVSIVPVEKVNVSFDVTFDGSAINVDGNMVSQSFTPAGEDYSNSIVALEYTSPEGLAYLHPISMGAGVSTCHSRFAPSMPIDIVYISPSGQTSTSSRIMNANGEYMDSFMMYENGTWVISFTYTDLDGNQHHWNETAEVADDDGQMAPNADGYDKACGTGTFTDVWGGPMMEQDPPCPTCPTPCPWLTNGEWRVRALFGGDSVHGSTVTDYQTVRVEGMPINHPSVNVGDTVDLEGTLDTAINSGSELRIVYTTPQGNTYEHIASVDADNRYSDRIVLDEEGTWHINLRYMDVNRDNIEWNETIIAVPLDQIEEPEESSSSIPAPGLGIAVIALMGAGLAARRKES